MKKLDQDLIFRIGIDTSLIFNGHGFNTVQCRALMKEKGCKYAYGVSECTNCGHTLRTTSWNCVHCSPSSSRYAPRHYESGFVYIALSNSLGLVKIGTCKVIKNRKKSLNEQKYAGANDWTIIEFIYFPENSGMIEKYIQGNLKKFSVQIAYEKEGKQQIANELFNCTINQALSELLKYKKSN